MKREPQVYDFSAQPRVAGPKPKYRQERQEMANLMNDPRVVRGNTYAAVVTGKSEFKKQQNTLKLKKPSKKESKRTYANYGFDSGFEPTTPRPVENRDHFSVQTEAFVETLRDKPIEYQKQCQTDFYLDRPVQRLFNPIKTGMDYSTQIEEHDPDLFSFDYEVEPILDALLNKILDASRYELFEQEQLEEKQKKNQEYQRARNAALAETQKLQSNQSRTQDEYERRQLQYKKMKEQNAYTQKKLIGRVLSKQYLKNLHRNTNMILEQQGFFREPLQLDLYDNFLPWLYQQIQHDIVQNIGLENDTSSIIQAFESQYTLRHADSINNQQRRRKEIETKRLDEIERRRLEKEERKAQKLRQEEEQRQRQEAQVAQQDPNQQPTPPSN